GNDRIAVGVGQNVVFGDSGAFSFSAQTGLLVDATSTAPSSGGNDETTSLAGRDVLVGGDGRDTIKAGDGDNVVAGDSARMAFADGLLRYFATTGAGLGGDDEIRTGAGDDLIFGGFGSDEIDAHGGDDVVFGDDGA